MKSDNNYKSTIVPKKINVYNSRYDDNKKILCRNALGWGISYDSENDDTVILGTLEQSFKIIYDMFITFSRPVADVSFELIISSTKYIITKLNYEQISRTMYQITTFDNENLFDATQHQGSIFTLKITLNNKSNSIKFIDIIDNHNAELLCSFDNL